MKKKEYSFQPRLPDGTRLHLRFRTKREKDEYIEEFKKKIERVKLGLQTQFEAPPVKAFAALWLSERHQSISENKITLPGWKKNEEHCRLHIIPHIGEVPLDLVTPNIVEELTNKLKGTLGPASRNRVLGTLSAMFNRAIKKRLVSYNPVMGVEKEDEESVRPKVEILETKEDVTKWLKAAYEEGPMWGCLESLYLNTGCRKTQAIPLRWQDFDEEHRRLWMGRIWEHEGRVIRDRSKGRKKAEAYWVGINDALAKALMAWKAVSKFPNPDHFIFCNEKGEYLVGERIYDHHVRLRDRLKLKINIHSKRHTYGSHYISKGGRVEDAQTQLGHKSIKTTQEFYQHQIKEDMRAKANAINFESEDEGTK